MSAATLHADSRLNSKRIGAMPAFFSGLLVAILLGTIAIMTYAGAGVTIVERASPAAFVRLDEEVPAAAVGDRGPLRSGASQRATAAR